MILSKFKNVTICVLKMLKTCWGMTPAIVFSLEDTKITLFVSLSEVQDQSVIYVFAIAILYFAQLPMSDSDLCR